MRSLVSGEHGAKTLTIKEVVIHPGFEGRLHTHSTEKVIMVISGSVQMLVGEEVRTVRSGSTLLAPAGVPHKLVNNTWVPALTHVIYPTQHLESQFLDQGR